MSDDQQLVAGPARQFSMLRRLMLAPLIIAVLVYVIVAAFFFVQQRTILYYTADDGQLAGTGGLAVPGSQRVTLAAADGIETTAWYVPPAVGRPVFLFLHGQGGQLVWDTGRWRRLRDAGAGVLALSYRGYQGSQGGARSGSPTERGLRLDARAAFDWLTIRHPSAEIVIHGHSLGTGVAVQLAADIAPRTRIKALVLEAPFTAAVDVAAERMPWLPVRLLMLDQYRSRDAIADIRAPLLILHGDRDTVIPFTHAERLLALASEPKRLVKMIGSDHNSLVRDGLYSHVWAFLGDDAKINATPK